MLLEALCRPAGRVKPKKFTHAESVEHARRATSLVPLRNELEKTLKFRTEFKMKISGVPDYQGTPLTVFHDKLCVPKYILPIRF